MNIYESETSLLLETDSFFDMCLILRMNCLCLSAFLVFHSQHGLQQAEEAGPRFLDHTCWTENTDWAKPHSAVVIFQKDAEAKPAQWYIFKFPHCIPLAFWNVVSVTHFQWLSIKWRSHFSSIQRKERFILLIPFPDFRVMFLFAFLHFLPDLCRPPFTHCLQLCHALLLLHQLCVHLISSSSCLNLAAGK